MKTPTVLCSLALFAAAQAAAVGPLRAQAPASPSPVPSASPANVVAGATPAPSASLSPATEKVDELRKKILEKYDLNHNGVLDPDEQAALERDKAAKKAERLKKYDKNGDGKLDESERAAMRADREAGRNRNKPSPTP